MLCIGYDIGGTKCAVSLGRVEGCFTAYLTDYSTFEHTISLRALPSRYD